MFVSSANWLLNSAPCVTSVHLSNKHALLVSCPSCLKAISGVDIQGVRKRHNVLREGNRRRSQGCVGVLTLKI